MPTDFSLTKGTSQEKQGVNVIPTIERTTAEKAAKIAKKKGEFAPAILTIMDINFVQRCRSDCFFVDSKGLLDVLEKDSKGNYEYGYYVVNRDSGKLKYFSKNNCPKEEWNNKLYVSQNAIKLAKENRPLILDVGCDYPHELNLYGYALDDVFEVAQIKPSSFVLETNENELNILLRTWEYASKNTIDIGHRLDFILRQEPHLILPPSFERSERTLISPSGIPVHLVKRDLELMRINKIPFIFNHFAVNVTNMDIELDWYLKLLNKTPIINDNKHTDALTGKVGHEIHLFEWPYYYITIRKNSNSEISGYVDHSGLMATERKWIDISLDLLKILSWKIELGPIVIDGSYLIHFRGPDGRAHDFFYPTRELS